MQLRTLQSERCFWKSLALIQFALFIFIFLYRKSDQNERQTKFQKELLSTGKQIVNNIPSLPVIDIPQLPKKVSNNNTFQAKQFTRQPSKGLEMIQSQTSIELVREIQTNWIKPPSSLPYNITPGTVTDLSAIKKLHKIVLNVLGNKKNGFFIECGAFDGVNLSNTLHLERDYNWTGLLIEADPEYYAKLAQQQRKAWSMNACLSTESRKIKTRMTRIKDESALSTLSDIADAAFLKRPQAEQFDVQCFPLASILGALGQSFNVDYFSLDIEGAELKVLQTIPWNFVYIKVLSIDYPRGGGGQELIDFLASKNFKHFDIVNGPWIHDHVFVNNHYLESRQ